MDETSISSIVSGGAVGVAGARVVRVENLYVGAAAAPPSAPAGPIPPCPYLGLAYFGPQDSSRFFGRDKAIAALQRAIARRSFTALIGASGAGKSSVVLAGLAPALDGQGGWRFSHFRVGVEPDKNPFSALARALAPLIGAGDIIDKLGLVERLAANLAAGDLALANVLAQCRSANPGKRILLIADQFEEVFTLVSDEALRSRFIDALVTGFPDPPAGAPPDICLILTLRADFYNAALHHRALADKLQDGVENLGPMTREELREAIVRPAEAAHVQFEAGLVDTILDEVAARPGSLPLLQFALREMWSRLETPLMTRAVYDSIGGVEGALAKRAQAIFDGATLNGDDAAAAALFRRLFTRLVTLGEGAEDTRRIVGRAELGPEAWTLAQRLAGEDNRLVVTAASAPGQETAEVAHEALIRNWPALIEWVNRDRAFQSWLRQLKPRVDEWRADPLDQGALLRGGPLALAEEWIGRRGDEVNEEEKAFVAASAALRDAEKRHVEHDLQREQSRLSDMAAAQAKTARAQRGARRALAAAAAVVVFASALFVWQNRKDSLALRAGEARLAEAEAAVRARELRLVDAQAALAVSREDLRKQQAAAAALQETLGLKERELKQEAAELQDARSSLGAAPAREQGNVPEKRASVAPDATGASKDSEAESIADECVRMGTPLDGRSSPSLDAAKAVSVCRSALNLRPGDALLQYSLARALAADGSYDEAAPLMKQAAETGLPAAQASLGAMYDQGRGVPQDVAGAASWYQKAANQGDALGESNLGMLYEQGRGVSQDDAQAFNWLLKAADQGDRLAEARVAHLYEIGRGVDRDLAKAKFWYHKAADKGDEGAASALARLQAR